MRVWEEQGGTNPLPCGLSNSREGHTNKMKSCAKSTIVGRVSNFASGTARDRPRTWYVWQPSFGYSEASLGLATSAMEHTEWSSMLILPPPYCQRSRTVESVRDAW